MALNHGKLTAACSESHSGRPEPKTCHSHLTATAKRCTMHMRSRACGWVWRICDTVVQPRYGDSHWKHPNKRQCVTCAGPDVPSGVERYCLEVRFRKAVDMNNCSSPKSQATTIPCACSSRVEQRIPYVRHSTRRQGPASAIAVVMLEAVGLDEVSTRYSPQQQFKLFDCNVQAKVVREPMITKM